MLSVISMSSKKALTQAAKKEKMNICIYVGRGRKRLVVNRSTFDASFPFGKINRFFNWSLFIAKLSHTPRCMMAKTFFCLYHSSV